MADIRITDLTEDTTPTSNDVVPVTDVETGVTKKVKLGNLSKANKVTGTKDAGQYIELDGIQFGLDTTGNRSFGFRTSGSSFLIHGSSWAINHTPASLFSKIESLSISSTFTKVDTSFNMGSVGNVQTIYFFVPATGKVYLAIGIINGAYLSNLLSLERLN